MHRFFAPSLDPGDETVDLPRDEAEHLTRVLRLGVGDTVSVFDGRGHEFLGARRVGARRRDVARAAAVARGTAAESTRPLTLGAGGAQGRQDGRRRPRRGDARRGRRFSRSSPSATETTVAALHGARGLDRWRRVALASVKQSRRAVVPEIRMPLTLRDLPRRAGAALRLMLVEPARSRRSSRSRCCERSRRRGCRAAGRSRRRMDRSRVAAAQPAAPAR